MPLVVGALHVHVAVDPLDHLVDGVRVRVSSGLLVLVNVLDEPDALAAQLGQHGRVGAILRDVLVEHDRKVSFALLLLLLVLCQHVLKDGLEQYLVAGEALILGHERHRLLATRTRVRLDDDHVPLTVVVDYVEQIGALK